MDLKNPVSQQCSEPDEISNVIEFIAFAKKFGIIFKAKKLRNDFSFEFNRFNDFGEKTSPGTIMIGPEQISLELAQFKTKHKF